MEAEDSDEKQKQKQMQKTEKTSQFISNLIDDVIIAYWTLNWHHNMWINAIITVFAIIQLWKIQMSGLDFPH